VKQVQNSITTLIVGVSITLASIWYAQNHGLLPADASKEAPLIDGLFNAMLGISTGLFLLIQGALLVSVFKFRRRKGDETDAAPVHGNVPLEIVWTAIPAVIVLWLAVYSFDVYKAVDSGSLHSMHAMPKTAQAAQPGRVATLSGAAIAAPLPQLTETAPQPETRNQQQQDAAMQDPATANVRNDQVPQRREAPGAGVTSPQFGPDSSEKGQPPEFVVNVTGLRYAWIFTYPDSGVTAGELHLPTGQEVELNISANDVIHAFWVPEFRLKQDAIPGRQSRLRFTPTLVGTYPLICAELCGPYHGAMKTQVIVQTPEEYSSWVQEQTATASSSSLTIASNPAEQSASEFLAPYAQQFGALPQLAADAQTMASSSNSALLARR